MNPPSALHGAMSRDRKPFTYTPGGLDLSEIKSSRMAARLMRNAMNEGVPELPKHHIQSPPMPSTPIAVPNFNCLPVQVFPTFNLPANPKSLLRTRSNPGQPRDLPVQKTPAPQPSQFVNNSRAPAPPQYDTFSKNTSTYSQINNNRPISMYEYASPSNYTPTSYENGGGTVQLPEMSYDAQYFRVAPKNNLSQTFGDVVPPIENKSESNSEKLFKTDITNTTQFNETNQNQTYSEAVSKCQVEHKDVSPFMGTSEEYSENTFKPEKPQPITDSDYQRKFNEVNEIMIEKKDISPVIASNETTESGNKLDISNKQEIKNVKQINEFAESSDNANCSFKLEVENTNTIIDTFDKAIVDYATFVPETVVTKNFEDLMGPDNQKKEVKVVKKQVITKKENNVEDQNGSNDQNGDSDSQEAPPSQTSAARATKVEVTKKTLPDGSTEVIKKTITTTKIDGKTSIKTKTETTIIPKEDDEEDVEEEEEEEEEENVEATAEEKKQVVEEPKITEVKNSTAATEHSKEDGEDNIIKTEERSETTTITSKKVVVVQDEQDEEEEEEEEEVEDEEIVEPVPVTFTIKKPFEKSEPSCQENDIKNTQEDEEETEEIENEEVDKQETTPEKIEDIKKEVQTPPLTEKEEETEEEEEEEKYEEAEEKEVVETKEEARDPDTESKNDEIFEETVQEVEVKEQEVEPEKPKVDDDKPTDEIKAPEEPKTLEVHDNKQEQTQQVTEEKQEIVVEKHEHKNEKREVQEEILTQKAEQKEEKIPEQPEQKVPLREPSVPLEKVEDVEIKPIGLGDFLTKTRTENTEIITNITEKPTGLLTEINRIENIVTVNRTTKTLDRSYEDITQQGVPTVKTYFTPHVDRIMTSPQPNRPYQPVYPPEPTTERRHSLLLERLSVERQMPSDYQNNYQYSNQTVEQQKQWSQEPQAEVLTVSNVKPSQITNQQWYQQKENVQYNNVTPSPQPAPTPAPSWTQPKSQTQPLYQPQPQYQPSPQPQYQTSPQPKYQAPPQQHYQPPVQSQPQPQYQPTYTENIQENTSNTYQNTYSTSTYTPKPSNWATSTKPLSPIPTIITPSQPSPYSYLNKDSSESYQKTSQHYSSSSSYVPPPWEQDPNYVAPEAPQNYYQAPPQTSSFSPAPSKGWKPNLPTSKFNKTPPTAYIPPKPNQSFVVPVSNVEPTKQPGRKTYYSEYERRYISVPESTYIPGESKFQLQPDPSPAYYYDNNEPAETVEPQWRRELREFTEKSQTQITTETNVKPPWEAETKYAKAPEPTTYTATPTWSQTVRPQSWRERSFESEFVSQEWPKTNTLGRGRPLSSYGKEAIPERTRGVSVDRYNPNSYQSPVVAEHPPVQTHTHVPPAPHATGYHNPNVPAYHARASAEPREQVSYQQPRNLREARASPFQSRSFKYLQWITGTED